MKSIEGENVRINCSTTGIPIPNVTWTRSGNEAKKFPPSSPLKLKNISREEDGLYWCVAENGLGKVTASVRIIVQCKYIWIRLEIGQLPFKFNKKMYND